MGQPFEDACAFHWLKTKFGKNSMAHSTQEATVKIVVELRKLVELADEEFNLVLAFHEVWKLTTYDKDLHLRMGTSYASQAFNIIQLALRREMLLGIFRLWDSNKDAVRMTYVEKALRNPAVIEMLAVDRQGSFGHSVPVMPRVQSLAQEAVSLIRKYMEGGTCHSVFEKLKRLRHERLAHRQIEQSGILPATTNAEIEILYRDMAKLVSTLLSLVCGTSYDPLDTAKTYEGYAEQFWAGSRGERTEGHPNYRLGQA